MKLINYSDIILPTKRANNTFQRQTTEKQSYRECREIAADTEGRGETRPNHTREIKLAPGSRTSVWKTRRRDAYFFFFYTAAKGFVL